MAKFSKILCFRKKWIDIGNKFLTTIWTNQEVKWEIVIIIVSAICSALCAVITNDMLLTVIYIGITAVIDIISVIESEMEGLIDWEKIIGGIFKIKQWIKYLVCGGFALRLCQKTTAWPPPNPRFLPPAKNVRHCCRSCALTG